MAQDCVRDRIQNHDTTRKHQCSNRYTNLFPGQGRAINYKAKLTQQKVRSLNRCTPPKQPVDSESVLGERALRKPRNWQEHVVT